MFLEVQVELLYCLESFVGISPVFFITTKQTETKQDLLKWSQSTFGGRGGGFYLSFKGGMLPKPRLLLREALTYLEFGCGVASLKFFKYLFLSTNSLGTKIRLERVYTNPKYCIKSTALSTVRRVD